MKILVVNAGSSSLKYQLIDMENEQAVAKGGCERIGLEGSFLKHKTAKGETVIEKALPDHKVAVQLVLDTLTDAEWGVIGSMKEIDAVGHRVVHSAEDFNCSVLLTDDVMKICAANSELAPLHQPANITGIEACRAVMPDTPMVGVFDTAFHSTMPDYAYMYALPLEFYEKYKVRRYGFHGTSHKYVSALAAEYLNNPDAKIITCHLGNGSSISAVKGGKCVDTSMGFTPLEGVPMGTRSGDLDPAVVEYLCGKLNKTVGEVLTILNKKSGVSGVSGVSSDFRDLRAAKDAGNDRARLALDLFTYRVKKYVGSYAAALGGADAIVFTAGIGENDADVRESVATGLEYMGAKLDPEKNRARSGEPVREISAADSRVKILVIPTNEELVIARETREIVEKL
ncbi:MAG: acetate kinase [Firmicutes bacterium]|nr:acetate kinase [Bacillota bacterium]